MLTLYHNPASTCSQKVRLVLAHKGLDYQSEEIDLLGGGQHDPAYVKLNPNHVVPTLVDDGAVFIESTLINEYLDDAYPDIAMRPGDAGARYAMRMWGKLLDEKVHPSTGIVTFAIGPRSLLQNQTPEERAAYLADIPNPAARALRASVLEHGVEAPEFGNALRTMVGLLERMEQTLKTSEWVTGDAFSIADANVLPYVLRLDHLAMTPFIEQRPALAAWYQRVQGLPAFETAVASWLAPPLLQMFRANGEAVWDRVQEHAAD